jgi:hypothetical protein
MFIQTAALSGCGAATTQHGPSIGHGGISRKKIVGGVGFGHANQ